MAAKANGKDKEPTTTVRLSYMGKRQTKDNRIVYCWQQPDGMIRSYAKQLVRAGVGAIYDFAQDAEERVFRSGQDVAPRYVGQADAEVRLGWQVEHDVAETLAEEARQARKDAERTQLEEILAPVGVQYGRLRTAAGRRALLATVVEIITAGKSYL